MFSRRDLGLSCVRRLAVLALVLGSFATGAVAADPRLAKNPALGRVAAANPAEAQHLLDDIELLLHQPPPPPMRGSPGLGAEDAALLVENPLLRQAFAKDATATLGLLKRIKAAGGGRR